MADDSTDHINAIHQLRFDFSSQWLFGRGIEIGAGASPQRLPDGVEATLFDKRENDALADMFEASGKMMPKAAPMEEIPNCFPDGANFLIAHQVLEHIADPIGALLEWARFVTDGGVIVLGLPHANYCPDRGRVIPNLEHVLLDHLLQRDNASFESREHAYSCMFGWMNDWSDWAPLDKRGASERAHLTAHAEDLDMHFHSFTTEFATSVWQAAAVLSERNWQLLRVGAPEFDPPNRTIGEILYLFRVTDTPTGAEPSANDVRNEIALLRDRLTGAIKRLDRITTDRF